MMFYHNRTHQGSIARINPAGLMAYERTLVNVPDLKAKSAADGSRVITDNESCE